MKQQLVCQCPSHLGKNPLVGILVRLLLGFCPVEKIHWKSWICNRNFFLTYIACIRNAHTQKYLIEVSISAIWPNYNGPTTTILPSQNLLTWQLPSPIASSIAISQRRKHIPSSSAVGHWEPQVSTPECHSGSPPLKQSRRCPTNPQQLNLGGCEAAWESHCLAWGWGRMGEGLSLGKCGL